MAALIKQTTGLESELVPGSRGEFSVWVGQSKVAEKGTRGFPVDVDLISAVTEALA